MKKDAEYVQSKVKKCFPNWETLPPELQAYIACIFRISLDHFIKLMHYDLG